MEGVPVRGVRANAAPSPLYLLPCDGVQPMLRRGFLVQVSGGSEGEQAGGDWGYGDPNQS